MLQGKATAALDSLAAVAEHKIQNPTPSMSQGGASSDAPNRAVLLPNDQDEVSEPEEPGLAPEAPGPSGMFSICFFPFLSKLLLCIQAPRHLVHVAVVLAELYRTSKCSSTDALC